jgi:probable rRNA maturation factor
MRDITLTKHYPRLRLDRRALLRALVHLDTHFRFTPADLVTLSPAGRRRAKSQIPNLKSQKSTRRTIGSRFAGSLVPALRDHSESSPGAVAPGELSVTFLTDPALAKLHADYLDDPSTTDVITFEGDESLGHAGDICVSVDTALAYAEKHGVPFAEELLRYVIHGWLHLAGYDDLEPRKKRRLRAAEERALKLLRAAGPLPAFSLKPSRD